jgi:hypothetical protein
MGKKTIKGRSTGILTPPIVSNPPKTGYDAAIAELRGGGNNLRCSKVRQLLESLNFTVTRTGKGNHYVVKHPRIPEFPGTHYNCGHGANPKPKPAYIGRLIRVLEENKEYLI